MWKNEITGFFKLQHLKNYWKYEVFFLHEVRHPWKLHLVILFLFALL